LKDPFRALSKDEANTSKLGVAISLRSGDSDESGLAQIDLDAGVSRLLIAA
jgi:hypothetical protein